MNFSKNAATAIAVLIAILCSISNVNATHLLSSNIPTPIITELEAEKGGPRDVVQTMIDVIVLQPETNYLKINIVNSEGEVVIEQETEDVRTILSTTGLEAGTYRVETEDEGADFQEFVIEVL
mgnify:CR=1 FL=1